MIGTVGLPPEDPARRGTPAGAAGAGTVGTDPVGVDTVGAVAGVKGAPPVAGLTGTTPVVGLIMGSSSDWDVMRHAAAVLDVFAIAHEARVVSAHRMPHDMVEYGAQAQSRGLRAIIAGAGGAAHLPGMMAALTPVPVFGVPVPSRYLRGEDSLLSIVQMPRGVPVATFAIGESGAVNAALHVVANLAMTDAALLARLQAYRERQTQAARNMVVPPADPS